MFISLRSILHLSCQEPGCTIVGYYIRKGHKIAKLQPRTVWVQVQQH